jgi:ABC-2 type transport system ATP-binding protein
VRQKIGVIFQNPSLDRNLSAEENIRMYAMLYGLYPFYPTYGMMPKAYKNRVQELAEVVGLKGELFKAITYF